MRLFNSEVYEIGTENDKSPENLLLLMFLCNFCQIFEKLRRLQCLQRSIKTKFVVQKAFTKRRMQLLKRRIPDIDLKFKKIPKVTFFVVFLSISGTFMS